MSASSLAVARGRRTQLLSAAALTVAALTCLFVLWHAGRPVDLADAPERRLACVSYAPSHAFERSPSRVTPARLRADLEQLAERFDCVRTYTVGDGMARVPRIAQRFGLHVLLGLWIGGDTEHNQREVRRGLAIARRQHDALRAIVVGNEVLLRGELTSAQLRTLLVRVRSQTDIDVTYAEIGGVWARHAELADAVSFITVHLIPYWDDVPLGIDTVVDHVGTVYEEMQRTFPGKRVFVGETGWPSSGRPRAAAVPSRVNQARYIREFVRLAHERDIPYNLIEAFDQPWKRRPEGTVGGYWGLYDAHGHTKFPLVGPVAELPQWWRGWVSAVFTLLIAVVVTARAGSPRSLAPRGWLLVGAAAAWAGATMALQWDFLVCGNRNPLDWVTTGTVTLCGWLAFVLAVAGAVRTIRTGADAPVPAGWVSSIRRRPVAEAASGEADALLGCLRFAILMAASYASLGLAVAGRHRDFPTLLFLPSAAAAALLVAAAPARHRRALRAGGAIEEVTLSIWLLAASAVIAYQERLANTASIEWALTSAALALTVLAPLVGPAREDEDSDQQA